MVKTELKNPEERKKFLEEHLKKQTAGKREKSIRKLNEEIEKSEKEAKQKKEHEEKENTNKRKAEQELADDEMILEIKSKALPEPETEEKPAEERKYVPKRHATDAPESGLERELISDKAPVPDKATQGVEIKEQFRRDISYSRDISGRDVFNTLVHYLREEGFDANSIGSATAQQAIVGRVVEYFGNSVPPEQVAGYISSLRQSGGWLAKDNNKYKLNLPRR